MLRTEAPQNSEDAAQEHNLKNQEVKEIVNCLYIYIHKENILYNSIAMQCLKGNRLWYIFSLDAVFASSSMRSSYKSGI